MVIGEEPLSYGYGGTGKVSVNCKFRDYGTSFGLNDVVTSYIVSNLVKGNHSFTFIYELDLLFKCCFFLI